MRSQKAHTARAASSKMLLKRKDTSYPLAVSSKALPLAKGYKKTPFFFQLKKGFYLKIFVTFLYLRKVFYFLF